MPHGPRHQPDQRCDFVLMSNVVSRFATKEPTACAVCRRHAVWLGYGPPKRERPPVIWLCDDNGCHAAAKKVYAMPNEMLDAYEIGAALEAGAEPASYLEEIGKTDLAALDRRRMARIPAPHCRRLRAGDAPENPRTTRHRSEEDRQWVHTHSVPKRLIERGFAAVPIMPGTKRPGFFFAGMWIGLANWQKRYNSGPPPETERERWAAGDTGIGVIAGQASHGLIAIDIDSEDPAIPAALRAVLPATDVRKIGVRGETLFYYGPTSRSRRAGTSTASGSSN